MKVKNDTYPSILNQVIGPVMRGPSASHCAASVRIGKLARELMDGNISSVLIEFDPHGSLATTHTSQGSDMGLFGGLLGWDTTDTRLTDSAAAVRKAGIDIDIKIKDYGAQHPNTYRLTLKNDKETHQMTALSTGGGMTEIIEIDSVPVSIQGDYYETLMYSKKNIDSLYNHLQSVLNVDDITIQKNHNRKIIEIKSQHPLPDATLSELKKKFTITHIKSLSPVLPVLSRKNMTVPFLTSTDMLEYNKGKNLSLWELALRYESLRSNVEEEVIFRKMEDIVRIVKESIQKGIRGTEYDDRILGYQSDSFRAGIKSGKLIDAGILNRIILYVTALMEMKSSMGIIVAAPTAGSCGTLPGACVATAESLGLSNKETTKAMLAAGMTGIFIAAHATFAAEVGGCQAECGAGSGMAAAALVSLKGGSVEQCLGAASMALQNSLGMICDPVANRVEVPCLGKNIMAASNALACANMALAEYDPVIPLDEVIDTMDKVGKNIPSELRCTGLGGLSVTRTSKMIEKKLNR
ncbi:MAG: L-serine ammonia-lyase, iron-sulfur-dependent, subunit alpha [bacterium]